MKRLTCMLAIALLTACGGGGSPIPAAHAQSAAPPTRVILGIGDSIMAGYIPGAGVSERLAWEESFIQDLRPLGTVIGAPVGGASTAAALTNQVAWAKTPFDPAAAPLAPDVVVVMLGTNDAVMGVPRAQALANVRQILEHYPHAVRVLVSPPHWSEPADEWMGPWSRDLQALAVETGSVFVDAYTLSLTRPWQCTVNNRHICEPAHREIGRLVAAAVQRALATP